MNLKFWQWKKDREEKELVRQVVQRMECNVSRYTIQLVSPNGTVLSQAPYTVGQTDFTFAQGCKAGTAMSFRVVDNLDPGIETESYLDSPLYIDSNTTVQLKIR